MAVRFYDEALLNKIKNWIPSNSMHIVGVNESKRLFESYIDRNNDKPLQLPLIAISRPGGYSILNKNKRPLSHNSSKVVLTSSKGATLNAIPIGIAYQIDIYCRYLEEADEYARNFIFNIINYPKLTIEIPYENQGVTHDANIRLTTEVDDNSDIPERLIPGQFTRLTIGLNIDDAYLFDIRIKDNLSLTEIQFNVEGVPEVDNLV